jgi:hypothetical protein
MKYWKITNETETHYFMTYKDGLNVDILPFNPSGDCQSGGIYFASEDIFAFLNYGPWIREVTIPEGVPIYENPGSPKKFKSPQVILGPRREWANVKVLKELIDNGANIHSYQDYAIRWASLNEQLEIVQFLANNGANIHSYQDYAIRWASINGRLEVVEFLKSLP